MKNEVKTLLPAESRPQVDDVREFLDNLDQEGQHSLLSFIQGARFMQSLMTSRIAAGQSSA